MHNALRSALVLPALLALWFCTNSLFALSSHRLLLAPSAPWPLFLDLTILQALVSFLLSHLPLAPPPNPPHPPLPPIIPLLHLLSVTLTNASYALLGAAPTLLLKLLEPLPTFLLSRLLLPHPPPRYTLLSLLPLLCGILLFTLPAHPLPALSPILLSTVSYPLRNILLTLHAPSTSSPNVAYLLPRFRALHSPLVLPLVVLAVAKFLVAPPHLLPSLHLLPHVCLNASLFAIYHIASLALLAHLRPLSHSLANALKRFGTVAVAALGTGLVLGREQVLGLALTAVGFGGYVFGGRLIARGGKQTGVVFRVAMGLLGAVSLILVAGVVLQKGRGVGGVTRVVAEPEALVVHVERKYQRGRENVPVGSYAEGRVMEDGGNSGNFVWQHAAYVSLVALEGRAADDGWEVCWGRRADCYHERVEGSGRSMVSYRPGANYFNLRRPDAFAEEVKMLRAREAVPMLVGIGAQAGFARNESERLDLEDGREVEVAAADFVFTDVAKEFAALMQERGLAMLVRGDFTQAALRTLGYEHAVSAGCPTLFLSEELQLGQVLQRGYDRLAARVGDTSLKVGINVKEGPRYMKFVKGMLHKYPNSVVYAQGRGDMAFLEKSGVPFDRVRMFTNVEAWRDDMRGMDLSVGARIHGNMVAVSVGVPVLVVAPDWRVLELVRRMKIRHLSYWQAGAVLWEDADLVEVVGAVEWDAGAFDRNRCQMARRFGDTLGAAGIPVARHVEAIAAMPCA